MRKLKVTYLTLQQHSGNGMLKNIGDRIIYLGVRNIMQCALGEHDEEIRFLEDSDAIPPDTDIAVVCGMPQILNSRPSNLIKRIAETASCGAPVKINLGAGSFYFDAFGDDRAQKDQAFADRMKAHPGTELYEQYAGFDLCTCRDMAGEKALRGFGVTAIPLPCPGFFSALLEPRPLVRRPNQLISVLNGTASFWNAVKGDIHDFYRRLWETDPTRIFIAHDDQDCTMLADLGIPFIVFDDAGRFLQFLASSERILSLRVHGALPAWTLGLDVTLLGLDRRALLGEDFGAQMRVIPLRTNEDMRLAEGASASGKPMQDDQQRRDWLMRHLGSYVDNIRAVVSEKLGVRFDHLAGQPLGGKLQREVEALRGSTSPGRYFTGLFHSTERVFPVPPALMRSRHAVNHGTDAVTVTTNGTHKTIVFGPYIRIPKARWRATATVTVTDIPISAKHLQMTVSKGIPGIMLGKQSRTLGVVDSGNKLVLEVTFDNPSDTGEVELVFNSDAALPEGTRIVIAGLQLERSN
jgi:hypothetical protein